MACFRAIEGASDSTGKGGRMITVEPQRDVNPELPTDDVPGLPTDENPELPKRRSRRLFLTRLSISRAPPEEKGGPSRDPPALPSEPIRPLSFSGGPVLRGKVRQIRIPANRPRQAATPQHSYRASRYSREQSSRLSRILTAAFPGASGLEGIFVLVPTLDDAQYHRASRSDLAIPSAEWIKEHASQRCRYIEECVTAQASLQQMWREKYGFQPGIDAEVAKLAAAMSAKLSVLDHPIG